MYDINCPLEYVCNILIYFVIYANQILCNSTNPINTWENENNSARSK